MIRRHRIQLPVSVDVITNLSKSKDLFVVQNQIWDENKWILRMVVLNFFQWLGRTNAKRRFAAEKIDVAKIVTENTWENHFACLFWKRSIILGSLGTFRGRLTHAGHMQHVVYMSTLNNHETTFRKQSILTKILRKRKTKHDSVIHKRDKVCYRTYTFRLIQLILSYQIDVTIVNFVMNFFWKIWHGLISAI